MRNYYYNSLNTSTLMIMMIMVGCLQSSTSSTLTPLQLESIFKLLFMKINRVLYQTDLLSRILNLVFHKVTVCRKTCHHTRTPYSDAEPTSLFSYMDPKICVFSGEAASLQFDGGLKPHTLEANTLPRNHRGGLKDH